MKKINFLIVTFLCTLCCTISPMRIDTHKEALLFTTLPHDLQLLIVASTKTVKHAARIINVLVLTSRTLNIFFNDTERCLTVIKAYSQKFNCSEMHVAQTLCIKAAQHRVYIQNRLLSTCTECDEYLPMAFERLRRDGADFSFTYNNRSPKTPLIITIINEKHDITEHLLKMEKKMSGAININKQDHCGHTALWHCLRGSDKQQAITMSKKLCAQGARATASDNNDLKRLLH